MYTPEQLEQLKKMQTFTLSQMTTPPKTRPTEEGSDTPILHKLFHPKSSPPIPNLIRFEDETKTTLYIKYYPKTGSYEKTAYFKDATSNLLPLRHLKEEEEIHKIQQVKKIRLNLTTRIIKAITNNTHTTTDGTTNTGLSSTSDDKTDTTTL